MKNRTGILPLILLFCSGLAAQQAPVAQTPPKIGIIYLQQALSGTKEGQQASQELTAKAAPKQKDFSARQQEITQLEQQLNRSAILSDEKKSELATEIDEKKKRLERDTQDAEEDMRTQQQTILQHLGERLMTVVHKYAKDNGYTLIMEAGNQSTPVVYSSDAMDITKTIVALYDKTYPVTGKPAGVPKP